MTAILSYPFRLGPDGAVVTVEDGTTQANAEAIAVLVGTRLGERDMCPTFGVIDPAFADLSAGEVAAGLGTWGPDGIEVTGITRTPVDDTTVIIALEFTDEGDTTR